MSDWKRLPKHHDPSDHRVDHGPMTFTDDEAWCDGCGQRWFMLRTREGVKLGWRPV